MLIIGSSINTIYSAKEDIGDYYKYKDYSDIT